MLLSTAITAALKAGARIMDIYNNDSFEVDFKSDNSPLTKADIASHEIIEKQLKGLGHPILSEEGKDIPYSTRKHWESLWIVDPIDGTKEFIKKNGEFTVNIALVVNQKPVLGVIYAPALDWLYFSDVNKGAFKVEKASTFGDQDLDEWIATSAKLPVVDKDRAYTVVASRSHLSPETEDFINQLKKQHPKLETISIGSSLKLCKVAEGAADAYPRFAPTMEWDTAAGNAICTAAGYQVIDQQTQEPMLYNRAELLNNWFLVKSDEEPVTSDQ